MPGADVPRGAAAGGEEGGTYVLVVEDDEDVSELLGTHLRNLGARVTLAESGEEAMACLDEELPDLVIADIMLPGIDGRQLFDALKNMPGMSETPVIAATVLDEQDIGRHFDACISKPFGRADIARVVGPYLATAKRETPE